MITENFLLFASGLGLGILLTFLLNHLRLRSFKRLAQEIIIKAEKQAESNLQTCALTLKQKELEKQRELEKLTIHSQLKLQNEEERIKQKEDKLEARMNLVEKKLSDIDKKEAVIALRRERIDEEKKAVRELEAKFQSELERVCGLTSNEAKTLLFERLENEVKIESANLIKRTLAEAKENVEENASRIIATAIGRMAASVVSEATVTTVALPSDEMKGRIIGKEGRNIRALELATGVNFIIDDTPGAVVLSGFDPIRKQIAKMALTELVLDGRIHPTRIEEVVEKTKMQVNKQIKAYGDDAALRIGAVNLHPELTLLLGKLKFRYSFGQNVLDHSLEVAHLMGIMACELGLDPTLARRIGLLHDVGKAVSHEVEGSHAIIGHDYALRFGESEKVAIGIGCHHGEMMPTTIEASLCSAADALSASRPGARVEAVEHYLKRLQKLEDIAHALPGVERAFAMQAGREVRVMVHPESIDDDGLINLAREVAKRVESGLTYPGKIKVTVIREKRAIEYAL